MAGMPTPRDLAARPRQDAGDGDWFRLLVTGSRDWTDRARVRKELERVAADHGGKVIVVHGKAPRGLDRIADQVARSMQLKVEGWPADWYGPCRDTCRAGHRRPGNTGRTWCPAAGDYRNQAMVDAGAGLVLAFYADGARNQGTADCAKRAKRAGIKVERVDG